MEITWGVVSIAGFSLLLTWVFVELLNELRFVKEEEVQQGNNGYKQPRKITLVSNILISCCYLIFCVYELWRIKTVSVESGFKAFSWVLVSVFVFVLYFKTRTRRKQRKWPLVLVLWWLFSSIVNSVYVSVCLVKHLKSGQFLHYFLDPLETNYADFGSLPLSILLCFNSLHFNYVKKFKKLEQPLLHREEDARREDVDTFSNAGVWGQLSFCWLNPLFEKGRVHKLELHHVPQVPEPDTAEKSFASLQESRVSSLPRAIIYSTWRPLTINAIFAGINTLSSYVGPFLITYFVDFLSNKQDGASHRYGLLLAFLFFLAKTVESLSQRQWYFGAHRIGFRVRAALMASIYAKSLKINNFGPSSGKVVNFISVDAERIGDFCWYLHGIWLLPFQVFLALVILYRNLGLAPSMAAIIATVLVMVSNTPLVKLQKMYQSKIMEGADSRIKTTAETLKNMRVLKLHSWEMGFLKNILKLRDTERSWLKKYLYLCATIAFLFWTSPTVVSVTTFGVCILVKTPLTSGNVLSALATFRILQEPIYNLPELITMIAQTKVSIERIQDFIREDDTKKVGHGYTPITSNISIEIRSGEYTWETSNPNLSKPTIKIDKDIKIMKGSNIAVCGTVGSGKTSFLCSILNEIPRISGKSIKVYGSKAYVPQSAWIQTGTVRENVLFGKEMEKNFYEAVLKACALDRDIEMWADGDCTLIGERGVNLSGGQKQRIQLARAIYSDSDIYLLDDPFSAVDAHTRGHLFQECLLRVLSDKTIIYVTHQLEFLDASDLVLVMQDGKIVQSGKYEDLIADTGGELVKQMEAHRQHSQSLSQPTQRNHSRNFASAPVQMNQEELTKGKLDNPDENVMTADKNNEEVTETGRVKWRVYSTFVTSAYKGALVPVVLLCHVIFQGLQIASNYWIAWATEEEGKVSKKQLIGVFVLLSGGSSLFVLGRAMLLSTIAIESSQRLFLGMINSIFKAPISFYDSTPSSQILNRSSNDQSTVDKDVPYRLAGLVFALVQLLSICILMSHVAWQILLLFLAIIVISVWYQAYYITTARDLARMMGVKKSPILHHLSESIAGATTIRCFNQEGRFLEKNQNLIDNYSRPTFYNSASMEWLSVRINFLFNLVFFFMLIILVTLPRAAIDPSMAGLAATYGLNLNVLQAWVIWNLCNVENKMISVERILQFSNIPGEAPLEVEECKPNPDWPTDGAINIENLHLQYRPSLPMILKGITCIIPGKKKIGVVGRTGSGKSTLIQALFRVVEPSNGRILIDGVDIGNVGLHDLRSRLSIIPQDPTLFQGTMRTNLDPLMEHSDTEIWEVLNKCHLGTIVRQDHRLLEAPVAEDGENWSVGQRQLVCLARVLLNKRRILVLDEATASVDTSTDNLMQKTIRDETSNCTVITVAHRIPTVIDNDLVLLLDEGQIVEYDSPTNLLKDDSSAFSKLAMEFVRRS